jgi:pilus assembly protein CpaF
MLLQRLDFSREWSDEEIASLIEEIVLDYGKTRYIRPDDKYRLCREIFNSVRRLDVLQDLIDDPAITEIMVNGNENIFYEKDGELHKSELILESEEKLEDIIQQIVAKVNRSINEANPIVDARLADGSRVNAVLPPVAIDGAILTIRKFGDMPLDMDRLIAMGSISKEAAEYLKELVQNGFNIVVSGGTGTGKTTFLNALSGYVPKDERVITIEDSAELKLLGVKNLVRLETRNANAEGRGEIGIKNLIKTALRMRPDRLIVGEVRDGGAALDMLIAMNTGHDGSLSTIHSNSAEDTIGRLETLVLTVSDMPLEAVRRQIASAVDIIVHLGRMRDKSRKVVEITEVGKDASGLPLLNPLYSLDQKSNSLCEIGKIQYKTEKFG